jgi:hypothetical protein
MSLLVPCAAPVIPALPNTGLDVWLMTGVGGIVVAGGITAVIMAKTLKGKLTALALPVFAVAGLALGNPQPSIAATGAPTVTTEISVGSSGPTLGTDTISLQTDAVFNNPENCGTLTYQWETNTTYNGPFSATGEATSAFVPFSAEDCGPYNRGRVKVTLTNNSGSVSSTSNDSYLCD